MAERERKLGNSNVFIKSNLNVSEFGAYPETQKIEVARRSRANQIYFLHFLNGLFLTKTKSFKHPYPSDCHMLFKSIISFNSPDHDLPVLCVQHVLLRYYLRTKPVDHRPVALVMVGVRTRAPASAAATVPKGYGSVPRLAVNWKGEKSLNLSEIVVVTSAIFLRSGRGWEVTFYSTFGNPVGLQ